MSINRQDILYKYAEYGRAWALKKLSHDGIRKWENQIGSLSYYAFEDFMQKVSNFTPTGGILVPFPFHNEGRKRAIAAVYLVMHTVFKHGLRAVRSMTPYVPCK